MGRLLKRVLWLGCLAGTIAAVWLYHYWSNDEYLRHKVQTLLEQQCPAADVQLDAARRNVDGTISLIGLSFQQDLTAGRVEIDVPKITLQLAGARTAPEVTAVELWRPHLRLVTAGVDWWKHETNWLDEWASELPVLRVHEGTIELVQRSPTQGRARLDVPPASNTSRTGSVDSERPVLVFRGVELHVGSQMDHSLRVAGGAHSDLFDSAEVWMQVDADGQGWSVVADVRGMHLGPSLHQAIAQYMPEVARAYAADIPHQVPDGVTPKSGSVIRPAGGRPESIASPGRRAMGGWAVQGRGRVRLKIGRTATDQPMFHQVAVKVKNASLAGPLLPFPLHGIQAVMVCRNGVAQILEFHGRNGASEVTVRGRLPLAGQVPQGPSAMTALHIEASNLELDDRLRGRLPAKWRSQWDRFRPSGTVRMEFDLLGRGDYRVSGVKVECLDTAFSFEKFPYRLEHLTGTVHQEGSLLSVNLTAPTAGGAVHLNGTIADPGPRAAVSLNIDADRVSLDEEKLRRALAPEVREMLTAMDVRGTGEVHWHVQRERAAQPYKQSATIRLEGCSIRWRGYPVDRIAGTLILEEGTWRSADLRGGNDQGVIAASGTLGPREDGFPLDLVLRGQDVELGAELRNALAPRWQQLWERLAIKGRCGFEASITAAVGRDIQLRQIHLAPRDASFQPPAIAYRYDALHCPEDGGIWIRPVRGEAAPGTLVRIDTEPVWEVVFDRLEAQHGPSRWRGSGRLRLERAGKGELTLERLAVDRLVFDEPLLAALPPNLARACRQMSPSGVLHLRQQAVEAEGEPALVWQWSDVGNTSHRANWKLGLLCGDASFSVAGGLTGVSGSVQFEGEYQDGAVECRGLVALEKCTWQGLRFSDLRAPVSITRSARRARYTKVVVGDWDSTEPAINQRQFATAQTAAWKRHLTATVVGGQVTGDLLVLVGRDSAYALRAHLEDGRLEKYAAQVLPGRKRLAGRLTADWFVKSSPETDKAVGFGYLAAEDGDLYDLPLVLNLLGVAWDMLKLQRPASPSVHRGSVALWLRPEGVEVRRMELVSDTITFRGKGWMTQLSAESPVNLTFYPVVWDDRSGIPLLGDLFHQAGKQLVEFQVGGSLRQPRVTTRPIPNVEGTIQELGSMGNTGIRQMVQTLRRILDVQP